MAENSDRVRQAENDFKATISEIQKTDDTFLNRSLLNVAIRQNDLIFALKQVNDRGGR